MKKGSVDEFIIRLSSDFDTVSTLIHFIDINEDDRKKLNKGLDILNKKIKHIKSAKTMDELDKYLKVKKLLKKGE